MRGLPVVLFALLSAGCAGAPEPTMATQQAATPLMPAYVGLSDGGKLGTRVAACGSTLLAATEPGTGRVWFRPATYQNGATAGRAHVACIGDRVFSVGANGVEGLTTTGQSYPSSYPANVLSEVQGRLLIASATRVFLLDVSTQIESESRMAPMMVPGAVAGSPSHFYLGYPGTGQLVALARDGGAPNNTIDPSPQFGAAMVTGEFAPNPGHELAVAFQGGVRVFTATGQPLWSVPQPAGAPAVPSLSVAKGWLPSSPVPLDLLIVGYLTDELVGLYLGDGLVETLTPAFPGGEFGASVASAQGQVHIGAPLHEGVGAVYSAALPSPPTAFTLASNCSSCPGNSTCFGSVICVPRPGDAGVGDGGANATDGGAVDAGGIDAGAATDAGSPDAGSPDAGSPDAGSPDAGSPDAGGPDAGAADAGPIADAGLPDAGGGKSDAGMSDGGSVKDAGVADGGPLDGGTVDGGNGDAGVDFASLSASGCTCTESTGLLWVLGASLLARRRQR